MITDVPELYGLLLIGGQSTRMGKNKSLIDYHGKPQAHYLFELLEGFVAKAFVSVKDRNTCDFTSAVIQDNFDTKGPINGILSAMKAHPNVAWLVLAVDLPLLTSKTIQQLIDNRDPSKMATAFATKETNLPEPLIAIWEPQAKTDLMKHHLEEGKNCPRKFLINSEIKLIHPSEDSELFNANNPEEASQAKSMIK